jgi:hypothetical protein
VREKKDLQSRERLQSKPSSSYPLPHNGHTLPLSLCHTIGKRIIFNFATQRTHTLQPPLPTIRDFWFLVPDDNLVGSEAQNPGWHHLSLEQV